MPHPDWNVHAEYDRRVMVYVLEVLAEPLELVAGDVSLVVAASDAGCSRGVSGVDVEDVVEYDEVYLSDVEGVVVGCHDFAERR